VVCLQIDIVSLFFGSDVLEPESRFSAFLVPKQVTVLEKFVLVKSKGRFSVVIGHCKNKLYFMLEETNDGN
jgi:hypothetical protein